MVKGAKLLAMATFSVAVASGSLIGAAGGSAELHCMKQSTGEICQARFSGSSRIVRSGAVSSNSSVAVFRSGPDAERRVVSARAQAGEGSLQQSDKWGEGVSLGTALLPPDVDLARLENLLFQVLVLLPSLNLSQCANWCQIVKGFGSLFCWPCQCTADNWTILNWRGLNFIRMFSLIESANCEHTAVIRTCVRLNTIVEEVHN